MDEDDPLKRPFVCLTCGENGVYGQLIARRALHCPKCDGVDVQHVDPTPTDVPEYVGPVGTQH